jgi:hypothetical protein
MTIFPPLIKSSTSTGDVCGASLNYSLGIGPYMVIEPSLIADLRPTQMTVGMREVHIKRRRLRENAAKTDRSHFSTRVVPVVLGPDSRRYLIDRHHFVRAVHDEGASEVPVTIIADLSALESDAFWTELDHRGWMHPFDDAGRWHAYNEIPKSVCDLVDDPFRSLAGALRRMGGYTKLKTPFSEFRWANFLRHRIDRLTVEREFDRALDLAIKLAESRQADRLPGWLHLNLYHRLPGTGQEGIRARDDVDHKAFAKRIGEGRIQAIVEE